MPMQPVFQVEGRKAQGARRKAGNAKEEHKARGIAPSDRKRYKTGVNGGEASEDLFERELCLPTGTQMTAEDLNRGVNVLRRCHKKRLMSDIVWCIIFEKRRQGHNDLISVINDLFVCGKTLMRVFAGVAR